MKELVADGLSSREPAKVLGYANYIALNSFMNKRGLHQK